MRKISALVLTVLMTLALSLSAHAADGGGQLAYAILYDDGTLVFQHGNTLEPGKNVKKTYAVDLTAVYTWDNNSKSANTPWYNERKSVNVVNFADKTSPKATAYWFYDCSNLKRVDNIQNLDTANVTSMRSMFNGCGGLTTLDVSHFDTANVTSMYCMFSGLQLMALDVSNFDTAKVTDMYSMFSGCGGLTMLDVSNFDTANVTYMQGMFSYCSGLTALDLSNFDTKNVTIMASMFYGCSGLKTIYASDKFTTASVTRDTSMFSDCTSLVGGNGTKYDSSHTNQEYARIDTASAPGYFTAKDPAPAPTPGAYAITAVTPDKAAGTLSVTLTNRDAVTVAVSYFNANGQFMSVNFRDVQANAGKVEVGLFPNAQAARVALFDDQYRPLCDPFAVKIG